MHEQNGGKIFRLFAGRQREVGRQLEAVAGGDAHGLHRCEVFLGQPRRHIGQLAQVAAFLVVKPESPARAVAHRTHDEFVLVAIHRNERDFGAGELLLEFFLKLAAPIVEELVFRLVARVDRRGENLALFRGEQPARIDFGMLEEHLEFLARFRVETDDGRFVAAEIRGGVELLVVEGEEGGIDALAEVRAEDFAEGLVLRGAVEQLGIHAIGLRRGANLALVVGNPRSDAAGILRDEFHRAGARVEAEDIEDTRIALVHADEEVVLVITQVIDHTDTDPGEWREILRLRAVGIDRVEMEVFIPAIVLQVNDLVLGRPEIAADVALGCRSQAPRLRAAVDRLDEYVEPVLPWREPRDVITTRADLVSGGHGIAEKIPHGNKRRLSHGFLRIGFHGRRGSGRHKKEQSSQSEHRGGETARVPRSFKIAMSG